MATKNPELEFHPDAWERFERAAKVVAKSPPRPKGGDEKAKASRRRKTKRRA
jgi:hypothetical protein